MTLVSMTGFGRGEAAGSGMCVEVELSSVNRKQFDLHVNLPRSLSAMEAQVHREVHRAISRGHVTCSVKVGLSDCSGERSVQLNDALAARYVQRLRQTARALDLRDDLSARTLALLPDVLRYEAVPASTEELWPLTRQALQQALTTLLKMKQQEGAALQKDIARRLRKLAALLNRIRKRSPRVPAAYRKALHQRIANAGVSLPDPDALAREVALFADRCDVAEEVTRLDSHFDQAADLMAAAEPVGRALDFLCQEMFREINTIGSKANDAAIIRQVIQFKAELERVREQVQNVE